MHLPSWDEIRQIEEQMDVLEHPLDADLFVVGPPGSGKTILAVRRALQVLGEPDPFEINVTVPTVNLVTFNRMLRRLAEILSEGRIAGQTMHSFVGDDYPPRTRHPTITLPGDNYKFNWSAMLAHASGRLG